MKDRPLVGVVVILRRNGKILLGKRKSKHQYGKWGFPGGHLEKYETILACAQRELFEETGLECSNLEQVYLDEHVYLEEDKHYITIFLAGDYIQNREAIVTEPDKCENWQWFGPDELPSPLMVCIEHLIQYDKSLS